MNNFPIQPPTDLFSGGLLGSNGGLFESPLTYLTDIPVLPTAQPPVYYSTGFRDDFTVTTGYDMIPVVCESTAAAVVSNTVDSNSVMTSGGDANYLFNSMSSSVAPSDLCVEKTVVCPVEQEVSTVTTDNGLGSGVSDEVALAEVVQVPNEQVAKVPDYSEDPVIDISINNVVCAFNTKCHLRLQRIAQEGMNVEYKKATGMVSMKLRKPRVTASIWSSGKVTCTGSRSEEEAHVAARKVARCLWRIFGGAKFTEFRVVNVLGTCSLPFGIRIAEFSRKYPKEASYEPELHPGVTYRIVSPKATLKIFSTGSITVTAPRIINVQRAIEHVYPLVVEFRMDKVKEDVQSSSDNKLGYFGSNKRANPSQSIQQQKRAHLDIKDNNGKDSSGTDDDDGVESGDNW